MRLIMREQVLEDNILILEEENIIYLNKLRITCPDAYARKLKILGISDEEVPHREISINQTIVDDSDKTTIFSSKYWMGGKPYVGERPSGFLPKGNYATEDNNMEQDDGYTLYLVDGDNHLYEALCDLKDVSFKRRIVVFISQSGLEKKLKDKYKERVDIVYVEPGNQAVDNRIKSTLGQDVRNKKYDRIFVISHDGGYKEIIKKYRKQYKLSSEQLDLIEKI